MNSPLPPLAGMETVNLDPYADRLQARLSAWADADVSARLWAQDPTVWLADPEVAARTPELTDRLGWLTAPREGVGEIASLQAFAAEIAAEGFEDIVLLGMGGSSLAPELYAQTFGSAPGQPRLTILDSTDPEAVAAVRQQIDPARTLFLVSSKSGSTLETTSFYEYFRAEVDPLTTSPGRHFVAITDPGSGLEARARDEGFRRVFAGPPEVGGRYSALTPFGLVPAALIGVPLEGLLDHALRMAAACGPDQPVAENPGLALGAVLGGLALIGRDKVTFFLSPTLRAFGGWVEQLLAESTGKQVPTAPGEPERATGILPVPEEYPGAPEVYGPDRLLVYLRLEGDDNTGLDAAWEELRGAGLPGLRFDLRDKLEVGAEFFRWEMATAAAGALLGINPFDQPNVALAKRKAGDLVSQYETTGRLPEPTATLTEASLRLYNGGVEASDTLRRHLAAFLAQAKPGDYLALQAFLPPSAAGEALLADLQESLRDHLRLAVTRGWGPRYLHSTGQLHKGDAGRGLFVQITHDPEQDLAVPGHPYSFGVIVAAQAQGDFQALRERGRRVVRLHLSEPIQTGLQRVALLLREAAAGDWPERMRPEGEGYHADCHSRIGTDGPEHGAPPAPGRA